MFCFMMKILDQLFPHSAIWWGSSSKALNDQAVGLGFKLSMKYFLIEAVLSQAAQLGIFFK